MSYASRNDKRRWGAVLISRVIEAGASIQTIYPQAYSISLAAQGGKEHPHVIILREFNGVKRYYDGLLSIVHRYRKGLILFPELT